MLNHVRYEISPLYLLVILSDNDPLGHSAIIPSSNMSDRTHRGLTQLPFRLIRFMSDRCTFALSGAMDIRYA